MNAKRRENMVGVLPKRKILMRYGESQGNWDTTAYTIIPDCDIQSTVQGMAQFLRAGEHLHRVIGSDGCFPDWRVQFYMSPTPAPDRRSVSSDGVS